MTYRMDGKREESPSTTLAVLVSLALVFFVSAVSSNVNKTHVQDGSCAADEYLNEGLCCAKCHPGFSLKKKCDHNKERSQCVKCNDGYYMDKSNYYQNCFSCRKCKAENSEKEVAPCTMTQNRECGCIDGYYLNRIGRDTSQCLKCKSCGAEERETSPCLKDNDRQCECKDSYYNNGVKCIKCKTCGDNERCSELCSSATTSPVLMVPSQKPSASGPLYLVCAIVFGIIMVVFALIIICLWKKQMVGFRTSVPQSPDTNSPETLVSVHSEGEKLISVSSLVILSPTEVVPSGVQHALPDCVPREFNVCHFIYFLLDHVPASRFKELLRCLGVSDRDIERAERDNRTFKEAQYQMLRGWCDAEGGGVTGTLSCARLQVMVTTLKNIGLTGCAEALEAKYNLETLSPGH